MNGRGDLMLDANNFEPNMLHKYLGYGYLAEGIKSLNLHSGYEKASHTGIVPAIAIFFYGRPRQRRWEWKQWEWKQRPVG